MDKNDVVVLKNSCSTCLCSRVCRFKEKLEKINDHLKDDLEKNPLSNGEERFFTVSLECKFYCENAPIHKGVMRKCI